MKTQLDFLKEAVTLAEQNPTLKIHFASSNEHCEDKSWTQQHITKVVKTWFYTNEDGEIYTYVNEMLNYYEDMGETITKEEARSKMEEVILIYTCA